MTRPNTDHLRATNALSMQCTHCLQAWTSVPGVSLELVEDAVSGFLVMHRRCPKPEAPSPQMALPGTEQPRHRVDIEAPTGEGLRREYLLDFPCKAEGSNGRHRNATDGTTLTCSRCGLSQPDDPDPLGIDASTDDPAPDIDPPGPYARFDELYPLAESPGELFELLHTFLTREQWWKMPMELPWHPASGIFNAVANWARIEKAHADFVARAQAGETLPGGISIPRREPMPEQLAELLGVKPKQKKGARPLTSPKRKGEPKK